ncbi:hypothetical protein SK128_000869 [Halocaridina rubra]|uniref:Secreted protein n=1 Tax=Halocaridina rubra TaxID=373956 RepID=A0AAN8XNL7_HALRR
MFYSSFSYKVLLVVAVSACVAFGRPQGAEDSKRESPFDQQNFGAFVGEIVVHSSHVAVERKTNKPEANNENDGPRASKLIGHSVGDVSVDSSIGSEVAHSFERTLSVSAPAITFSNAAQVVPIPAK